MQIEYFIQVLTYATTYSIRILNLELTIITFIEYQGRIIVS